MFNFFKECWEQFKESYRTTDHRPKPYAGEGQCMVCGQKGGGCWTVSGKGLTCLSCGYRLGEEKLRAKKENI